MECEVEFYESRGGDVPMRGFLESLAPKARAKVLSDLSLLKTLGPALREPHSKPLGDGLFELRTQCAGDAVRSLYFFYAGGRAIVTHGFEKKTRKTPRFEIDGARGYRDDWMERNAR